MRSHIEQAARAAALVAAALAILALFGVALLRLGYPFGLEWMEGGAIESVRRVLGPGDLYAEPTAVYVPFIYPPAYFYLAALVASLTGVGLLPLRLVSLLATAGSLAILYTLARRETGSRGWGLVAAGLFAATYELSGSWFDLARVDASFLFFALAGIALARRADRGIDGQLAAALCLALSCLTKQSALILAAPICLHALFFKRPRAAWLVLTLGLLLVLSSAILEWVYGGWYLYYQWLPASHAVVRPAWWSFWTHDLLGALPVCAALAAYALWAQRGRDTREALTFYAGVLGGTIALCWASRLHVGGYANVLMPLHAVLALLAAIGGRALSRTGEVSSEGRQRIAAAVVWVVVVGQFAWLAYDPRTLLPSPSDREAGEQLVARLATLEGDVLLPFHAYLGERAGRGGWMLGNAGGDVLRGPASETRERYAEQLRGLIRERHFSAIVIDGSAIDRWSAFMPTVGDDLDRGYALAGRAFESPDVFWPVTGAWTRPEYVLVPRTAAP